MAVEDRVELDERVQVLLLAKWGVRVAVDADDLGRHALVDLRLMPRFGQDHEAGVGVEVDEPWADDAPGGVNTPFGLGAGDVAAQAPHGVTVDAHGTWKPDVARPIDNLPAGDQYVEHGGVEATIPSDYAS